MADDGTPAAAATRRRCREVTITIGNLVTVLGPVITPGGQLNSLVDASPPSEAGGFVIIAMEPIHGERCAALEPTPRPCSCGAQAMLEELILK
jgi:hypothetical protein